MMSQKDRNAENFNDFDDNNRLFDRPTHLESETFLTTKMAEWLVITLDSRLAFCKVIKFL